MKLAEAIQKYVERKQAGGIGFEKGTKDLRSFCRHARNPSLDSITTDDVVRFLNGPRTSPVTWRAKYSLLRNFFEFWNSRGEMPEIELPPPLPTVRRTFTPYIYSREDIQRLLRTIRHDPAWAGRVIDGHTMTTLIAVLYGTGSMVGEMLNLSSRDVDLDTGFITIRGNRFNRFRRIPIATDLCCVLRRYVNWKRRKQIAGTYFFLTRDGRSLRPRGLNYDFQGIRQKAGVSRHDGAAYQPRLHDLRSTFAVHRISSWIKSGADLNRMLPALSVYIGQVGLASTQRFLFMTPERFRKELDKLSPTRPKKHWRDDSGLMSFLAHL